MAFLSVLLSAFMSISWGGGGSQQASETSNSKSATVDSSSDVSLTLQAFSMVLSH